jgi:hypothetical protein
MIEGSEAGTGSVLVTNGSECGSGRPKNIRIRIRILILIGNTAIKTDVNIHTVKNKE